VNKAGTDYRPCVGIALFNHAGKIFLGKRAGQTGEHAWQMPQGGIDDGEAPYAAAVRELREETNVTSVSLLAEAAGWMAYDLPPELIRASWRGAYRGQIQKWFAFRFEGNDAEIDILNPAGGHRPEFEAWRWAELAETPDLIVPFKRDVYRQVANEFAGFGFLA
jgi:putative (di)nucleoside polyphosphate hydrolase